MIAYLKAAIPFSGRFVSLPLNSVSFINKVSNDLPSLPVYKSVHKLNILCVPCVSRQLTDLFEPHDLI